MCHVIPYEVHLCTLLLKIEFSFYTQTKRRVKERPNLKKNPGSIKRAVVVVAVYIDKNF